MDKFLGRALGGAALLIGAGVFYNYVIYLPGIQRERQAEEARAAAQLAEQEQQVKNRYNFCMQSARESYDNNWTRACQSVAQQNQIDLKQCLSDPSIVNNQFMGPSWCQKQYGKIDPSPDCALPGKRADDVEEKYEAGKTQCQVEAKMGM